MAMARLKCARCGREFTCGLSAQGHAWCPRCGARLRVPGPEEEQPEALLGQTLEQYEILETLKKTLTGTLYKARHLSLRRVCVMKVLPRRAARDVSFVERFRREAHAVAAISHPNIVQIFNVGEDRGYAFIVMEYVEGETLADRLKRQGPLAPDVALDLLKQTTSALVAAHKLGIVHRNIKPSNLQITATGAVKVMDFGLAKRTGADLDVTAKGARVGTPLYMAPEVAEGQAADARSDLYSLGATFYHALTGRSPVDAPTMSAMILKLLHEEPLPLPPDVPAPLRGVIHRLLTKDPGERYATAQAVLDALEGREAAPAERAPAKARKPPATRERPRAAARSADRWRQVRARQRKWQVVVAVVVGVVVLAGILVLLLLLRR